MISEDMTYIEEDIHPYIPTNRHIHPDAAKGVPTAAYDDADSGGDDDDGDDDDYGKERRIYMGPDDDSDAKGE